MSAKRELSRALDEVAGHIIGAKRPTPAARIRQGVVAAVNAGPPKSLDVTIDGTVYPKLRYLDHGSAVTFAVGNTVLVVNMDGGGHVVVGRLA